MLPLGCDATPAPGAASAPGASGESERASGAPAASSDEALFSRWLDAMERQVEADARAGMTRTFEDPEDARRFLLSLSPAGFRPRPEYFAALTSDAEPSARRISAYVQGHPAEVERRIAAFVTRLEPVLKQVSANVQRQFPPGATASSARWASDPGSALAEAQRRGRATILVFGADWAMASKELDRNFADAAVLRVLDAEFVAARIDMTDDQAPATKSHAREFAIESLPTVLVFDQAGREVARQTSLVDVSGLLALLSRAK